MFDRKPAIIIHFLLLNILSEFAFFLSFLMGRGEGPVNVIQLLTINRTLFTYILLDILVCSIAVYYYWQVKIQMMSKNLQRYYILKCLIRDLLSNVFISPKFWLAKVFDLLCSRGNETGTNIVCYLYLFRVLFVLYEAELDIKVYSI